MGIGFKIFLYGFLGMVASILIYNLVRLFRSINPVECRAEKLLPHHVDTKTEVEEKPKGFWKRFRDNVEPDEEILSPDGFWERHWNEESKRLSDDFSCGLARSNIHSHTRFAREGGSEKNKI
jgi:hypothetical protein